MSTGQQGQGKIGGQQQKVVVLGLQNSGNQMSASSQPPVSVVPKAGFIQQGINKDQPPIDDLSHLA